MARGFFGSTRMPCTLRSTTRLKPWMSDATIGTPAAIASSSTIPNDSWPVFGAQKMSADREVADLVVVAHPSQPLDVADAAQADEAAVLAQLRPGPDHQQPRVDLALAEAVVGLEQVDEALALLEAADEQDVQGPVAQLLERLGIRETLEVDAVRDDAVLAREVAVDEVARRAADRDAAIQLVGQAVRRSACRSSTTG